MTENIEQCGAVLPRWKCHKIVHAFKITGVVGVDPAPDGAWRGLLYHDEGYFGPIEIDLNFMDRHKPKAGGYYVVYDDGYKSYSPAKAFEEGYVRI